MKKTILFVLVAVAFVLSSCLGDNDVSYTSGIDFAVVKKQGGILYVTALAGGELYLGGLSKYQEGDALVLSSYKIGNDFIGDIAQAEYANVSEEFPVNSQEKVMVGVADTLTNIDNKIGLTSISATFSEWANSLNDKWLVNYSYSRFEGEKYNLKFIYDSSKQMLKKGVELPANTVVVDVICTKKGAAIGTKTETKTENIVVNFSTLRSLVKPDNVTPSGVLVTIYFRYSKEGVNSSYVNYSTSVGRLLYFS